MATISIHSYPITMVSDADVMDILSYYISTLANSIPRNLDFTYTTCYNLLPIGMVGGSKNSMSSRLYG